MSDRRRSAGGAFKAPLVRQNSLQSQALQTQQQQQQKSKGDSAATSTPRERSPITVDVPEKAAENTVADLDRANSRSALRRARRASSLPFVAEDTPSSTVAAEKALSPI